jgi:hypothetical protein
VELQILLFSPEISDYIKEDETNGTNGEIMCRPTKL